MQASFKDSEFSARLHI